MCGIQAQVAAAAELALAARVTRVTRSQVRAALWDTRTLAKTWTVRGTLHLHPADELGTWLAARRGTREWTEGRWRAREGLGAREGSRLMDAIADALDGRSLTRTALADEVRRRAGSRIADRIGSGWAHLLGPAATAGILCHGPPQGSSATFVRADQWLGGRPRPDPTDALHEVARRFVATYGPATPHGFREWFYVDQDEAEAVFRSLAPELVTVEVDGRQAYLPASSAVARQAIHTPDHNDRTAATKAGFLSHTTRHEDDGQRSHAESTGCMDGLWVRCGHVQTVFPGMVDCKRANEPPRSPWVELGLRCSQSGTTGVQPAAVVAVGSRRSCP